MSPEARARIEAEIREANRQHRIKCGLPPDPPPRSKGRTESEQRDAPPARRWERDSYTYYHGH